MNITFLLDAPRCRTADDFLIRDVPGTGGRLDVVCRILSATFHTIPEWCPNLTFLAVLGGPPDPPLALQVDSPSIQEIPESELVCAVTLKGLFQHFYSTNEAQHPAFPHFTLKRQDWKETLEQISNKNNTLFYLIEDGTPIGQVELDLSSPIVFILGDDRGIPSHHEELFTKLKIKKLSLGKQSYLGSQVVTLILLELAERFNTRPLKPNR